MPRFACTLALFVALAGCGGGNNVTSTPSDRPATPPPGWRTVTDSDAGFTIAVPRAWSDRRRGQALLLRAPSGLVAMTVAADRQASGRDTPPAEYARQTLDALPDFEGSARIGAPPVRGSPYRSARLEGGGRIRSSRAPQRITVAAFQLPGRATFAVVVFRNLGSGRGDARAVDRELASLRAR